MTPSRSRPVTRLINTATDTTPAERITLSDGARLSAGTPPGATGVRSLAVLFKEVGNRFDTGVIIRELVFFVGRVQPVVGQPETHEDARNSQVIGEVANDGNRTAAADKYGLFPKNV